MKNILVAFATILAASTVMAQSYNCYTQSKGMQFSSSSWDQGTARNQAAANCRANAITINAECDANVYCDGGGSSGGMLVCSTGSRGYNFELTGFDKSSLQYQIINQCHSHPSTVNAECDANLICRGGGFFPPPPPPPPPCKPGFNCPGDNPPPPPIQISCSEDGRTGDQVTYSLRGPFYSQSDSYGTDLGGHNFRNRSVMCNGVEATITGLSVNTGFPGTSYVTLSPNKPGMSLNGCRIDVSHQWQTTAFYCN